jgi:hypothetical protein
MKGHLPRLAISALVAILFVSMVCAQQTAPVGAAVGPSAAQDLPALARAAKSEFRPLTQADVADVKATLVVAVGRLKERLARDSENGKSWCSFLQLDTLEAQLNQSTPDVKALSTVYGRFASGQNGLELIWFADVRDGIRRYIELASGVDNPGLKDAYLERLDLLAGQLEAYAKTLSPETATDIGESLAWLESARQAPSLVHAVRSRFVYPNFDGQVSGDVIAAGVAGPVDETAPIEDVILGTVIHGMGRTVGQTTAPLAPDPSFGVFDAVLQATNYSNNVGRNGPVCIYSTGTTAIGAAKRFWIDADGLHALPAVSSACARTTINDIQAKRAIIERLAWRRAGKQLPEAEYIASRHAEQRVSRRVDEQAVSQLEQANRDYQNKLRSPLADRRAFPREVLFRTTPTFLQAVGLMASPNQLSASAVPPKPTEAADLGVRLHQSMINNMAATVLSGLVLREDMLQSAIKAELGHVPDRLKPDPDKDQEPWTIVFARRDPITVAFTDNGFRATLRGREFYQADRRHPGMDITAVYKFEKVGQQVKAVRQGELQIFPPGFKPEAGHRLSVPQQTIRTLLQQRLGKILQPELLPQGFTPQGKAASLGKFVPVEMTGRDGWLTIGWRRTRAPAPKPDATASR